ncbi:coiled coil domain-containing protein [Pacificispira sp.]|uniref:coiled coil domain-containing protein n=1 Tax=Pacificispira sp. TaxID=2888761 RepID=UPI003BAA8E28
MALRDAYLDKLDAQLRESQAEIQRLTAKANSARADARIVVEEKIAELHARQEALTRRVESLRNAGDDAWQDLVSGAETAWSELRSSVRSASQRF